MDETTYVFVIAVIGIGLSAANVALTWYTTKGTFDRADTSREDARRERHQDRTQASYDAILAALSDLRVWAECQIGPHPMATDLSLDPPAYKMGEDPPALPQPSIVWSEAVLSASRAIQSDARHLRMRAVAYVGSGPIGPEGTSSFNPRARDFARRADDAYGELEREIDGLEQIMRRELHDAIPEEPAALPADATTTRSQG